MQQLERNHATFYNKPKQSIQHDYVKMIRCSIDPPLCNEQAGFWKCKSCSDHIFTPRQIVEQSKEWNTTLYETFIDLEKPFDSVHRESLWRLFRHYGISSKILNIIRMLYSNLKAKVICGPQLSENLSTKTGVKQGCILSPFLFNFWWFGLWRKQQSQKEMVSHRL